LPLIVLTAIGFKRSSFNPGFDMQTLSEFKINVNEYWEKGCRFVPKILLLDNPFHFSYHPART